MKALLLCTLAILMPQTPENTRVTIRTTLGEIVVELDARHAPATTENFLRYVDQGHYKDARFHRTVTPSNQPNSAVKIEVIQGGVHPKREKDSFAPIALERTSKTGILHKHGTISMARNGPDTATSDFFICIGDQPELDFGGKRNPDGQGFAAFGKVVAGMDLVRKIQDRPAKEQTLHPPVIIFDIARLGRS